MDALVSNDTCATCGCPRTVHDRDRCAACAYVGLRNPQHPFAREPDVYARLDAAGRAFAAAAVPALTAVTDAMNRLAEALDRAAPDIDAVLRRLREKGTDQ